MSSKDKSFSERYGYAKPKLPQLEEMDDDLRVGLWNVFHEIIVQSRGGCYQIGPYQAGDIYQEIFVDFLKKPRDEYVRYLAIEYIKNFFDDDEWYKVFDLIEFILGLCPSLYFVGKCNDVLEKENSAYRVIDKCVTPITSELEMGAVETALQSPFDEARGHIENALRHLSDRGNRKYKSSIEESILAVESIAQEITGKEKPLNALTQELKTHPNLTNALKELYNWTSKDGIRHAKSGRPLSVDQDTARFMLVTCSAFMNYIVTQNPKKAVAVPLKSPRCRHPNGRGG